MVPGLENLDMYNIAVSGGGGGGGGEMLPKILHACQPLYMYQDHPHPHPPPPREQEYMYVIVSRLLFNFELDVAMLIACYYYFSVPRRSTVCMFTLLRSDWHWPSPPSNRQRRENSSGETTQRKSYVEMSKAVMHWYTSTAYCSIAHMLVS